MEQSSSGGWWKDEVEERQEGQGDSDVPPTQAAKPRVPPPPRPPGRGRFPFSRFEIILHVVLSVVTLGFWLPIPLAFWLYRRGARTTGRVIGFGYVGFFALITLIVVIATATGGGSSSSNSAANTPEPTTSAEPTTTQAPPTATAAAEPPGDNMNYRTRQFVKQLRTCQAGVALLATAMQAGVSSGNVDLVELSGATRDVKEICSTIRTRMATMDTGHFDDQALTVEIAIDEYEKGLDDIRDYLDTSAPSKAANAGDHFQQGHAYAAQGIDEINQRRAVYGLPPLKK